jgi:hypothetical protein
MSAAARRLAAVADALPVLLLAAIAGAGSFTHIRDTAAEHGQHGPMSWAIAVCIDLTCVMAARERQRDKRLGIPVRRLSWPTIVLAGGVLVSGAANLAQAQPTAWGEVMAATPCAAFLVAVSMLERRAARRSPAPLSVPSQDEVTDGSSPSGDGQDEILALARRTAAEHQAEHGQPITRDALRARLGVSNQAASELLPPDPHQRREEPARPVTRRVTRHRRYEHEEGNRGTSTAEPHHPPAPRDCPPQRRTAHRHHDYDDTGQAGTQTPGTPADQTDEAGEYELSEEDREWARRMVASLPPLTSRQRDRLGLLLRKRR